jgi:hypothetical protein
LKYQIGRDYCPDLSNVKGVDLDLFGRFTLPQVPLPVSPMEEIPGGLETSLHVYIR